jgi:hypothetical protein
VTGRTPDRDQGRPVSDAVAGRLFDRLAGPDGLTATASTFARQDVLVALGAGLAGAGRTELEEVADRFLAERSVSVVADRALEERRSAGGGNAGAGQRGPPGRLRPGGLAAGPGGRAGRLDPDPALAGGRHPRGGCWWGSPWQPAGAPAGAAARRPGGCGGWLGAAVPAQPGCHGLAARGGGRAAHCSAARPPRGRGGWSCTTWPFLGAGPTSTTW